jgi:integrase
MPRPRIRYEKEDPLDPQFYSCAKEYLDEALRTKASRDSQESALRDVAKVLSEGKHKVWTRLTMGCVNVRDLRRVSQSPLLTGNQQRKAAAALRGVAKIARERRLIDLELYSDIKDLTLKFTEEVVKKEREYTEDEKLGRLIQICRRDESITGVRDATMLAMAYQTGLRRNELRTIQIDQIVEDSEGRFKFTVLGKGLKRRKGEFGGHAGILMKDWLAIRGMEPGPVFCRIRKRTTIDLSAPLSISGMGYILGFRLNQAGFLEDQEKIGWHDLRRKFATDLYKNPENSLTTIQRMLGHTHQKTTIGYFVDESEEAGDAAASINTPWH